MRAAITKDRSPSHCEFLLSRGAKVATVSAACIAHENVGIDAWKNALLGVGKCALGLGNRIIRGLTRILATLGRDGYKNRGRNGTLAQTCQSPPWLDCRSRLYPRSIFGNGIYRRFDSNRHKLLRARSTRFRRQWRSLAAHLSLPSTLSVQVTRPELEEKEQPHD
jgi:hypothetical protein